MRARARGMSVDSPRRTLRTCVSGFIDIPVTFLVTRKRTMRNITAPTGSRACLGLRWTDSISRRLGSYSGRIEELCCLIKIRAIFNHINRQST